MAAADARRYPEKRLMLVNCPTCRSEVELTSEPVRGNSSDGSDAWICKWCKDVICIDCYHDHTKTKHSERLKKIKK